MQQTTHFRVISTLNLMLIRISGKGIKSTNTAEKMSISAVLSISDNDFIGFEQLFHKTKMIVFGNVKNQTSTNSLLSYC